MSDTLILADIWGDVPTWIAALATVGGAAVAYWQLSGLNHTLRMNGLTVVLQIESELHARNVRMLDIAERIDTEKSKTKPNQKIIDASHRHLKSAIEQYLNAVDRLAFCLRQEYLPPKDWEKEYRDHFSNAISDFPDFFGPNSIYRNIVYMNQHWQDSGKKLKS